MTRFQGSTQQTEQKEQQKVDAARSLKHTEPTAKQPEPVQPTGPDVPQKAPTAESTQQVTPPVKTGKHPNLAGDGRDDRASSGGTTGAVRTPTMYEDGSYWRTVILLVSID